MCFHGLHNFWKHQLTRHNSRTLSFQKMPAFRCPLPESWIPQERAFIWTLLVNTVNTTPPEGTICLCLNTAAAHTCSPCRRLGKMLGGKKFQFLFVRHIYKRNVVEISSVQNVVGKQSRGESLHCFKEKSGKCAFSYFNCLPITIYKKIALV